MIDTGLKILGVLTIAGCFIGALIVWTASAGEGPVEVEPDVPQAYTDAQGAIDPAHKVIVHVYRSYETTPGDYASYLEEVWEYSDVAAATEVVKITNTYIKTANGRGWTRNAPVYSVEINKYGE